MLPSSISLFPQRDQPSDVQRFSMSSNVASTGVTITDPLVLYRALVSTNKIRPDPAQYRLALYLQKLYERLKDYEPTIAYQQRLDRLSRLVDTQSNRNAAPKPPKPSKGAWRTFLEQKQQRDTLSLTRTVTSQDGALEIDSPQGLMLYGEVGTGKSMLIDLFADCLPNKKKRRWHYNTFMLETIARMEELRRLRLAKSKTLGDDDHSLMWLARDMIENSPILFLDEFQLPDKAASKILNSLMTSFFHLGGVLIATSNRMPEELAKASGVEFAAPPSRLDSIGWRLGVGPRPAVTFQESEFGAFLEILKARCEVWEMEGGKDYRRLESETSSPADISSAVSQNSSGETLDGGGSLETLSAISIREIADRSTSEAVDNKSASATTPKFFFVKPSIADEMLQWEKTLGSAVSVAAEQGSESAWSTGIMTVYGRVIVVPRQRNGNCWWTFEELCANRFGPADYVTLASSYHTLVLTDIPVLNLLQKSEARRLINLLDALYEARCKLLISADAGPDDIFFPETRSSSIGQGSSDGQVNLDEDAVYAETFSEAYQDVNAPFRPNISSYDASSRAAYAYNQRDRHLSDDALEDDPPNRVKRDAQGPFSDERDLENTRRGPDFAQSSAFTGEDERFAYKRARSRLWEMCGAKWWARDEPGWWKPLSKEVRRWEVSQQDALDAQRELASNGRSTGIDISDPKNDKNEVLFKHGASPFRTHPEPPPKFNWTHIWGTIKWGKKAGPWGQGPEGLSQRKKSDE